jgi:uncharacterized protein YndB with AHSA1/START domain
MTNPRILGTLRRLEGGKGVVRMEDVYAAELGELWSAVTDPERLARWLVQVTGDLRVGGAIETRFTSSWSGPGRIEVCEPPSHLLVTLSPDSPDETVIEAWLSTEGDKTRLIVEERGIPVPELAGHGAGWQAHVEDLAAHLSGERAHDWRDRWIELTPAYDPLAADLA